jgi:succinate-acetate transporter protein
VAQTPVQHSAASTVEEAPAKKYANPTPLGLFGYVTLEGRSDCSLFITTLSFSVIEMGWGMGDQIGKLNGIVYQLHSRKTNDSGSLFFTGPILLLFASFAEWIVGNFFAFIVSYSHRLCISDV